MKLTRDIPHPTPVPDVKSAQLYMPDCELAIRRAMSAWNKTQLQDALRSAQNFIDAAHSVLNRPQS